MIESISTFFKKHLSIPEDEAGKKHTIELATAALMIEVARADYQEKSEEHEAINRLLNGHFDLTAEETASLIELAEEEARDLTSYHQFTSLINGNYGQPERIRIIELLWQVANADGEIEKYEDHLIRKIADLLYVSHSDFIAAKHRVLDE
jgi:uncharacterized tellurite resistance protein B-like protein